MAQIIFLILGIVIFISAIVAAFMVSSSKYRSGRIIDSSKILFVGTVLSATSLFIPLYVSVFREEDCGIIETFLISVHNVIRLFVVDGEFSFVTENIPAMTPLLQRIYTVSFAVLFVFAPILTFGFVLSFFNNVSAYKNYFTHFGYDVYIFSKLNERSLALAESLLQKKDKKRYIVFAESLEKDEQLNYDYVERARMLGADLFEKDVVSVNFGFHSRKRQLNFFTFGDDQSENINQGLKLVSKYGDRENSNLYVFSTRPETEMLLTKAFSQTGNDGKKLLIKTRIINEVQSLVLRNLYDNGYEKLFCTACDDSSGKKLISALVVGMGEHGTEMTKALSWYCQIEGYRTEINSVDISDNADDVFRSLCPELMDEKHNGNFDQFGEAQYKITVHPGLDVTTYTFDKFISGLSNITYVFIALGRDDLNIETSVKLRSLFRRIGRYPIIQAIVYSTDKKNSLDSITTFSGEPYDIDFIGDMKSSYSEEVILGSDIENQALKRHLKWGEEGDFWKYCYNYKSSMASAIHYRLKRQLEIPGIEKTPDDRTEEEKQLLRIIEHRRWNAYMRSEGFVYSGSKEKSSRSNLGKMHHCLIPFEDLSEADKKKDDD